MGRGRLPCEVCRHCLRRRVLREHRHAHGTQIITSAIVGQILPRKLGYPMKTPISQRLAPRKFAISLSVTDNYSGGF
jgi:hypothetical protein